RARRGERDLVLVWRLDRWGRSVTDLLATRRELEHMGVGFVSLTEALDLSTPAGRAMAGLLAMFAEFEREILRERTRAGLAHARQNGKKLGRPRRPSTLLKSGNCIAPGSANPRLLVECRSGAHRSAESWEQSHEKTQERPCSGRPHPQRSHRGRQWAGGAGNGVVLLPRRQNPIPFSGKVHRGQDRFAPQEGGNRGSPAHGA